MAQQSGVKWVGANLRLVLFKSAPVPVCPLLELVLILINVSNNSKLLKSISVAQIKKVDLKLFIFAQSGVLVV